MKRRNFLKFSLLSGMIINSKFTFAKVISKKTYLILDEVYKILFPKTNNMPGAKEFDVLNFLIKNINHKTFEDYDKTLILSGTDDFFYTFPNFLKIKQEEKIKIIKEIINTNEYAQTWLSKLIYYGIEAMLSDPIYGGNTKQIAWNSLNHNIGYPQPSKKYGEKL